jgi:CBS-domain-containing membrane protein
MSTIHRPATFNQWWYVAAAVLAGILLAVVIVALHTGHDATGALLVAPVNASHVDRPSQACFATPHYPTIELVRAGCAR